MEKLFYVLIFFLLPFFSYSQLPWLEDFSSHVDPSGVEGPGIVNVGDYPTTTPWTLDASGASLTANSDYGYVTGGEFVARDTDGPLIFTTENIDISTCTTVDFSIDFSKSGTMEASDYINVEYSTDGGATFTLITNWMGMGSLTNTLIDDFTATTVSVTGLTGTTMVLRITFNNNAGDERHRMDNISVTGTGCFGFTSITTGAVNGAPFFADCGAGTSTSGDVNFTSTGTFNAGNVYNVQLSDANGNFSAPIIIGSITSTANSGIITFNYPSDLPTGTNYQVRIISTDPIITGTTSAPFTITQTNPCGITVGTVTGGPFTINCQTSTTDAGTVDFNSVAPMLAGNVYSVEISDELGNFTIPIIVGTLNSTLNSGTIPITIPSGLNSGTQFRVRITSSAPAMISDTSAFFTVTQMLPCVPVLPSASGLIINEFSNGPSGTAQEYYEFVVAGSCGDLVDIRGFILDDNNGTFTTPPVFPLTGSGVATGHFRFSNDPQWASIPVGSLIVVYNACDRNPLLPPDDPTDSNNDSLYVVPHTNPLFERCTTRPVSPSDSTYFPCTYATAPPTCGTTIGSWGPLGLRNGGDAIQVRTPSGDYYHGISYGGPEISGGPHNLKLFSGNGGGMVGWFNDGDFFDISRWTSGTVAGGNETPGLPNNPLNHAWLLLMRDSLNVNCPVNVLPVELKTFTGHYNSHDANELNWITLSERNASHFIIQRSTDGIHWENVNYQNAVGNTNTESSYQFLDRNFVKGQINYYRLNQTDFNGINNQFKEYIAIDNRGIETRKLVKVLNTLGQEISINEKGIQIHVFDDGTIERVFKN